MYSILFSLCKCSHVLSIMSLFITVQSPHFVPLASQTRTFQLSRLIVALSEVLDLTVTFDWSKYRRRPGIDAFLATDSFLTYFLFSLCHHAVLKGLEYTSCQHPTHFFSDLSDGVFPVTQQTVSSVYVHSRTRIRTCGDYLSFLHELACIYCSFCCWHYNIKIDDPILPFSMQISDSFLCNFPALCMQHP